MIKSNSYCRMSEDIVSSNFLIGYLLVISYKDFCLKDDKKNEEKSEKIFFWKKK